MSNLEAIKKDVEESYEIGELSFQDIFELYIFIGKIEGLVNENE